MSKSEFISQLIDRWIEIYNSIDKRTSKAKEVKSVITNLLILVGRI